MMKPANAAALYVRVSSVADGEEYKLENQRKTCEDHLQQRRGIHSWKLYLDSDASAYHGKRRPEYERLKADVRAGRVDLIVARDLDRILRSMRDLEDLVDLVTETRVQVDLVGAQLDLNTEAGLLNARVLAAVAASEVGFKSARHKGKAHNLRQAGMSTGGPRPFGWIDKNGAAMADEAKALREATTSILEGGSLRSIYTAWNAAGIKTSFGGTWDGKSTKRVLMRWRNAGLVEFHGEPLEGVVAVWDAIVSRSEVEGVRAILMDPLRKTTPGRKPVHLLTNIAVCGRCGHGMTARKSLSSAKGKRYEYRIYRCSSNDGCYTSVRATLLDDEVRAEIRRILATLDPASLGRTAEERDLLTSLRNERAELERTRLEVVASAGQPGWSLGATNMALAGVQNRVDEIERELDAMSRQFALASMIAEPAMVDGRVDIMKAAAIGRRFDLLQLDKRREIIKALIGVTVLPGRQDERIILTRRDWHADGAPGGLSQAG